MVPKFNSISIQFQFNFNSIPFKFNSISIPIQFNLIQLNLWNLTFLDRGHCGHEGGPSGIPCVARQPDPSAVRWNHVTHVICWWIITPEPDKPQGLWHRVGKSRAPSKLKHNRWCNTCLVVTLPKRLIPQIIDTKMAPEITIVVMCPALRPGLD